jgi:hypothetical protein
MSFQSHKHLRVISSTAFSCMMLLLAACGYDRSSGTAYPSADAASVTLSVASPDTLTSTGDTKVVTAVVKDVYSYVISAPSLSWTSSAPSVATVVGSGSSATVTAVADGIALIKATSGNAEGTIEITVRRRLVSMVVSVRDPVLEAGLTTQLTVVGRDARGHAITDGTSVAFATGNSNSVMVAPDGLVTALFSSLRSFDSIVSTTLTKDGVTLSGTKRVQVVNAPFLSC